MHNIKHGNIILVVEVLLVCILVYKDYFIEKVKSNGKRPVVNRENV